MAHAELSAHAEHGRGAVTFGQGGHQTHVGLGRRHSFAASDAGAQVTSPGIDRLDHGASDRPVSIEEGQAVSGMQSFGAGRVTRLALVWNDCHPFARQVGMKEPRVNDTGAYRPGAGFSNTHTARKNPRRP